MNQTIPSTSMATAVNPMTSLTTVNLVLMAVFAVIVVIAIWWGARLAARRRAAARELVARQEAAEAGTPGSTRGEAHCLAEQPQQASAAAAPAGAGAEAAPSCAPDQALTQLKGLGPKLVAALGERGITRIDQIAALTPADAEALDAQLGAFAGRMTRDRWIEQARLLTAGERTGYEAQFGKLGD